MIELKILVATVPGEGFQVLGPLDVLGPIGCYGALEAAKDVIRTYFTEKAKGPAIQLATAAEAELAEMLAKRRNGTE